ncbi:MAG: alpha/beta hydrolase [Gammaproteobacteria bacterium]|nr:alpha/beta hydrolase [Gammaproteobacteria bacterium]
MKYETGEMRSANGNCLFTQCWQPAGDARAVLVIAHGLSEHSGRYQPFAEHFVERGFQLHALDHEGHGRSDGRRGHVGRFSDYIDALSRLIDTLLARYPQQPCYLVGHSMGGVISANYLLAHQAKLAGCVLSGAALATGDVIGPRQKQLLKLLSRIVPRVPLVSLEGDAVSRDPNVVKAYEEDPLVFRGKASARLLAEILTSADRALARAAEIELPLLILHGGDDKLANASGSAKLFERVSSTDKQLQIYTGLYHEIFLEPEREQVYADILAWLEKRLSSTNNPN